ncbi:MAG: hypothetical protein K6F85_06340, partial [Bacteroidales bacterium]|nr:hypothetical protein [Bacteroidales bacterium]
MAIAFLFAVTMNGFSQSDTVYIDLSDSNYFTYPEDVMFDSMVFYFTNASSNMVATELRHTDTQLVVYGVVISALNLTVIHPSFDTSLITFDGTE